MKILQALKLSTVLSGALIAASNGAPDELGMSLQGSVALLEESVPKAATLVADQISSYSVALSAASDPLTSLCVLSHNYSYESINLDGDYKSVVSDIDKAVLGVLSDPRSDQLIDALIALDDAELSVLIMRLAYIPQDFREKLSDHVSSNDELASRFVELLYEERSVLEISVNAELRSRVYQALHTLSEEDLPVGYFGDLAGQSIAGDVVVYVLHMLPIGDRMEVIEQIAEDAALSSARERLACEGYLFHDLTKSVSEWIIGQVKEGHYWLLKELLSSRERRIIESSHGTAYINTKRSSYTYDVNFVKKYLRKMSGDERLEVIAVNPHEVYLEIIEPIYENVLGELEEGAEPNKERKRLIALLFTVLLGINTEESMVMAHGLFSSLCVRDMEQFAPFILSLIENDVDTLTNLDLALHILAVYGEVRIQQQDIMLRIISDSPEEFSSVVSPRLDYWIEEVAGETMHGDYREGGGSENCVAFAGLLAGHAAGVFQGWEGFYRDLYEEAEGVYVDHQCASDLVEVAVVGWSERAVPALLDMWDYAGNGRYNYLVNAAFFGPYSSQSAKCVVSSELGKRPWLRAKISKKVWGIVDGYSC